MDETVEKIKFQQIMGSKNISKLISDDMKFKVDQERIIRSFLRKHPHSILNKYISSEADKEEYSESADIYGTVNEYLGNNCI